MSKPSPGVCGMCGHAVVQPDVAMRRTTYHHGPAGPGMTTKLTTGWFRPAGAEDMAPDWRDKVSWGHRYEDGKLKRVRCEACAQVDRAVARA